MSHCFSLCPACQHPECMWFLAHTHLPRQTFEYRGLSCVVACSRLCLVDAVVEGSNPICVAAAAWSLEWVTEMRNTGHASSYHLNQILRHNSMAETGGTDQQLPHRTPTINICKCLYAGCWHTGHSFRYLLSEVCQMNILHIFNRTDCNIVLDGKWHSLICALYHHFFCVIS